MCKVGVTLCRYVRPYVRSYGTSKVSHTGEKARCPLSTQTQTERQFIYHAHVHPHIQGTDPTGASGITVAIPCVRVYARVLVPPSLCIHTYIYTQGGAKLFTDGL